MGLKGSLEEFSLPEVIQIISFGQKTGCLSLETPAGAGAVVFHRGRIVASFDIASFPLDAIAASLPAAERAEVLRGRIAAVLYRLARSREGDFSFQLSVEAPKVIGGRDVAPETLCPGIEAIDLLLELACRQDEERRGGPAPPGAVEPLRPGKPPGSESERSVLLVDDEELVRRLLARYLVEGGYLVVEAGDVDSAVQRAARLGEAGVPFVLVADLNMPASAGDSFRGGFEVIKRIAGMRPRPPVVVMTDGVRSSRRNLPGRGTWSVVLKPGLSKLDPEEYEADMRALAGTMVQDVLPRVCGAASARRR